MKPTPIFLAGSAVVCFATVIPSWGQTLIHHAASWVFLVAGAILLLTACQTVIEKFSAKKRERDIQARREEEEILSMWLENKEKSNQQRKAEEVESSRWTMDILKETSTK